MDNKSGNNRVCEASVVTGIPKPKHKYISLEQGAHSRSRLSRVIMLLCHNMLEQRIVDEVYFALLNVSVLINMTSNCCHILDIITR